MGKLDVHFSGNPVDVLEEFLNEAIPEGFLKEIDPIDTKEIREERDRLNAEVERLYHAKACLENYEGGILVDRKAHVKDALESAGASLRQVRLRGRSLDIVARRKLFYTILRDKYGWSYDEIGELVWRDPTNIKAAIK